MSILEESIGMTLGAGWSHWYTTWDDSASGNNRYNPSLEMALKIAQVFNLQVEELFQLKKKEKDHETTYLSLTVVQRNLSLVNSLKAMLASLP